MKQVLRKGLREIVVEDVPDPVVVSDHVVVKPVCSLISSGTESASLHQQSMVREIAEKPSHIQTVLRALKVYGPRRTLDEVMAKFEEYAVLGYSGAGVVVDKHSSVSDMEVGERVAYGGEGTGHGEYILAGRNLTARVPDSVSLEQASFTTLGSIALNAVRIAEIGMGDVVVVIGLGLVGQLIQQLVRCQGGRAIATDLRSDRVALARRLGAEEAVSDLEALHATVEAVTSGQGADVVIVAAAAKTSDPCRQALDTVRVRGRLVIVGAVTLSFPWHEMYLKEVRLLMARAYGPGSYDPSYEKEGLDYPYAYVRWTENRNMEEFLRLVADRRVSVNELITHEFPLENANRAYETVLDASSESLAVLLRYEPSSSAVSGAYEPKTKVALRAPAAVESKSHAELSIGLIGAGNLARWAHLPSIRTIPGSRLRAVCSTSGARGKSYARRFGASYCCSSYDELLDDNEIDVIIITTRNAQHAAQASAALRAGKHVFVEKPMAITEDECREVFEAAQQSGKSITVGFNRRFAPLYRKQKAFVGNRAGPLVINCVVNSPGISGSYWMADPSTGGAILGEACHFVDLMYWLADSELEAVSAFSLPVGGGGEPIGQNNVVASFQFRDGSVGNLTYCTVGNNAAARERVEAFAPGLGSSCEDFKRLTVTAGFPRRRSTLFPEKGYRAQLEDFFDAIREGRLPGVNVGDGVRATAACLRMLDSARTGKRLEIDWESILGK